MKVKYDAEVDILKITFSDTPVAESYEIKPGIILNFDDNGNIVSIEILDASLKTPNPKSVEYAVEG